MKPELFRLLKLKSNKVILVCSALLLSLGAVMSYSAPTTVSAAATNYVFATFTGDTSSGEKLSIYTAPDPALNFTLKSNTGFGGTSGTLRDPSIMKWIDGKYYVAYTDPPTSSCCGKEDHFSIASSSDLVHWANVTTVASGVSGVAHVWAPEWYLEGGVARVIANEDTLNNDTDFKPYIYAAKNNTLTSWTGPTDMNIGTNHIDSFMLKVGSTYHFFTKNETTRYAEHATASRMTGPWTWVGTGDWAGWGTGMEGPDVVQLDDGSYKIYLDGQGSRPFLYATSKDLYHWSGVTALPGIGNLVRHGTVLRVP